VIIAITSEHTWPEEHGVIRQLLENGLDLLHIRKYGMDDRSIKAYVRIIPERFHNRLVLHGHDHLAADMGIQRLHFSERARYEHRHMRYQEGYILSTSVHSIDEFNALSPCWTYAFLSPAFPSISKPGHGVARTIFPQLAWRKNPYVRLIGLGGVDEHNYPLLKSHGADGAALLGCLWNRKHPLQTFITCKKLDQSG